MAEILIDFAPLQAAIYDAYAKRVYDAVTPSELKAAVTALDDLKDGGLAKLADLKFQYARAASGVREATVDTLADKLAEAEAVADAIKADPVVADAAEVKV